jgi:hypothetical protein
MPPVLVSKPPICYILLYTPTPKNEKKRKPSETNEERGNPQGKGNGSLVNRGKESRLGVQ